MLRSFPNVKERGEKMNTYLLLFFISLFIGLTGQLLLKKGMSKIGEVTLFSKGLKNLFKTVWQMFTNKFVITGVLIFSCSTLLWMVILSKLELSYIYPMVSLNYVLTALASRMIFKEKITKARGLSIAVIILGVMLVSSSA